MLGAQLWLEGAMEHESQLAVVADVEIQVEDTTDETHKSAVVED